MKKILFLIAVLITITSFAQQQGINYKALIKDDLGNIVSNTNVLVNFKILQGTAQTNVYEEIQSENTDINGIFIVNIGEGTVLSQSQDAFAMIDWASDSHFLNVQINIGNGFVDTGTTAFNAVAYAKLANNYKDNPWIKGIDKIYTDTNKLGINETNPKEALDVNGRIKVGDDPAAPEPSSPGAIRFNDATQDFEGYNGTSWVSLTKTSASGGWGNQTVQENDKANAFVETNADFGNSVSISGDYAIIGAPQDNISGGIRSGSAFIFIKSGSTWIEQAKLSPSDGADDDSFGLSVSISGDYAIVGALGNDDDGNSSGSAYIFSRSGSNWTQLAKLTPSDGAAFHLFGVSVAISGDYAIVGASGDNDNGPQSGSAYVFNRSGSIWSLSAKLTPSDGAAGHYFGRSVAISGDYAIVGVEFEDDSNQESGAAYIFSKSGNIWTQQAKLKAIDSDDYDHFGRSVAISGTYAVIGASGDDDKGQDSGSAYMFSRAGSTWTQQAKLTALAGDANDIFGRSVAISNDYVIVGAENASNNGAAYIFNRSGSTWLQLAKLTASDGEVNDFFGKGVSISNNNVIVGAPGENGGFFGGETGSVYFFEN